MIAADFHWLIGYLEGEGAFGNGRRLMLEVNATDYSPLKKCRKILGGRTVERNLKHLKRLGKKRVWRWTAGRNLIMDFLIVALRSFSPRRQKQILKMIKTHRKRKQYSPQRIAAMRKGRWKL